MRPSRDQGCVDMAVVIRQLRGPQSPESATTQRLLEMISAGCREEQKYAAEAAFILECSRQDLQEDLLAGGGRWWIAWDNDTPVGLVRVGPTGGNRPNERLVSSLYVAETHRLQGIGRRLVETALAAAKAEGCRDVYLFVAENSPARAFYAKLNLFRTVESPIPGYIKLQWSTTKTQGTLENNKTSMSRTAIVGLGLALAALGCAALIFLIRGR